VWIGFYRSRDDQSPHPTYLNMGRQTLVGMGLIVRTQDHTQWDTPHSVRFLGTRDQPVVATSILQQTTLSIYRHPCPLTGFEPAIPLGK
jgi:hypothetical protein